MTVMSQIYQLPAIISHENVEDVLLAIEKILKALPSSGSLTINCQELKSFDSTALSLILSIKRRAEKSSVAIHLNNVPEKLASLAKVYDLADIVLS
jgi:phospholipid transport system transporter-binding protein